MRALMNKLSTAWLVLALIVAPLQAVASPLADSGRDHCPTMHDNMHAAHAMHQQMSHEKSGQDMPSCPDCSASPCNNGQCHATGCCVPHLLPGMHTMALAVGIHISAILHPASTRVFDSLPPTALYRPPV